MSEDRAVPFYCPYCGEQDLRPAPPTADPTNHGAWHCRDCTRVFTVRMVGLVTA